MPRNASGTYTLPSGNPVVSGTLIDATWANNTLSDLGNEVTDSLSRSGEGAMLAPLRITDGVQATPSLAFSNEPSSGLYRAGSNEWWAVAAGVQNLRFTNLGLTTRAAAGAVGTPSIAAFGDVDTGIYFPGANELAIATGGAARMTFDAAGGVAVPGTFSLSGGTANGVLYLNGSKVATSGSALVFDGTNLGIGTASPAAKLHVLGSNLVGIFAGTNANTVYTEYRYNSTTTSGFIGNGSSLLSAAADSDFIVRSEGALKFATNGNNFRAVIDSSGNLGLGVTPSAWGAGGSIDGTNGFTWSAYDASIGNDYYYNSDYKYKTTGAAVSKYAPYNGSHTWYTAPSGTAGNTITFTQAMTLTAAGALCVGRTAVVGTETLSVNGGARLETFADLIGGAGTPELRLYQNTNNWSVRNSAGALAFYDLTGSAERARITSGGDLLVGTTSSTLGRLEVVGGAGIRVNEDAASTKVIYVRSAFAGGDPAINVSSNHALAFNTNNTERGRFTAGGYFKASNTGTYVSSTGGYHELVSNTADVIVWATNSNASPFGYYVTFSSDPNNATNYVFGANTGGTLIYRIYSNGTTAARSDARFKKNIETARDGYLADVNALRVVKYNWYNHEEGTPKELGLIAQEVEQVFPGLVKTENEGEEGECKAIKTSVLVPILIKALQEATTRIEQLEAKVAALEAK